MAHEVTHLPGLAHHSQDGKYAAVRFGELVPVAANDGGKLFQALRGAAGAATEPPRAKSAAAPVKLPLHGGRGDEAEELRVREERIVQTVGLGRRAGEFLAQRNRRGVVQRLVQRRMGHRPRPVVQCGAPAETGDGGSLRFLSARGDSSTWIFDGVDRNDDGELQTFA